MNRIEKADIRAIYALGAVVGIMESGNKDDTLHALVYEHTGKESISALTAQEGIKIMRILRESMKYGNLPKTQKPKKMETTETVPGKMTKAQKSYAWRLIYRLRELDTVKKESTAGERMVGAVQKILEVTATAENPFVWVDYEQGQKLIETLKGYIKTAERKQKVS